MSAPDAVATAGTVVIKFHFHASASGHAVDFDGVEHQDFVNQRATAQMTLPKSAGDLSVVVVGDTTYLQTRKTTDPQGQPGWWKIDVAQNLLAGSGDESVAGVPNGIDYLAYLRHVAGDVADEGDTTIDDVKVHHYSGHVDLAKVLANEGLDTQQAQLQELEQQGLRFDTSMDAFIDSRGLPHRVTIKVSAKDISLEIRMDFVDYGSPVDVVAPPDDQVVATRSISSRAEFLALSQEVGLSLLSGS